jgi:hypothetical protein
LNEPKLTDSSYNARPTGSATPAAASELRPHREKRETSRLPQRLIRQCAEPKRRYTGSRQSFIERPPFRGLFAIGGNSP